MGISKNIHLVFLRKDETIPPLFKECERKIRDMHPSWDITLWDEETGTQFLKYNLPEYVDAYAAFAHNVQRADFLRLALVYGLGGFYMDMDMYPLKALDSLLDKSLILAEEMTVNDETLKSLKLKYHVRIANYMFGGEVAHPFLRSLMNAIIGGDTCGCGCLYAGKPGGSSFSENASANGKAGYFSDYNYYVCDDDGNWRYENPAMPIYTD